MRLLLDTHVAIWAVLGDPRLTPQAIRLLTDDANEVFVSAITFWEIAIKRRMARRATLMPVSCDQALEAFRAARFEFLPITADHAAAVERLPMHHRDPFDHLLLAQALTEPMRLVTQDAWLASYDDTVICI